MRIYDSHSDSDNARLTCLFRPKINSPNTILEDIIQQSIKNLLRKKNDLKYHFSYNKTDGETWQSLPELYKVDNDMIMYTTLASATFHARLQHMHRQHMNMEWAIWHYGCCDKIYAVLNRIYDLWEWLRNEVVAGMLLIAKTMSVAKMTMVVIMRIKVMWWCDDDNDGDYSAMVTVISHCRLTLIPRNLSSL